MCEQGQGMAPASVGEALAAVEAGLAYLNAADACSLPTSEQAECLRALERAAAAHTAARSRMLAAPLPPRTATPTMASMRPTRG